MRQRGHADDHRRPDPVDVAQVDDAVRAGQPVEQPVRRRAPTMPCPLSPYLRAAPSEPGTDATGARPTVPGATRRRQPARPQATARRLTARPMKAVISKWTQTEAYGYERFSAVSRRRPRPRCVALRAVRPRAGGGTGRVTGPGSRGTARTRRRAQLAGAALWLVACWVALGTARARGADAARRGRPPGRRRSRAWCCRRRSTARRPARPGSACCSHRGRRAAASAAGAAAGRAGSDVAERRARWTRRSGRRPSPPDRRPISRRARHGDADTEPGPAPRSRAPAGPGVRATPSSSGRATRSGPSRPTTYPRRPTRPDGRAVVAAAGTARTAPSSVPTRT